MMQKNSRSGYLRKMAQIKSRKVTLTFWVIFTVIVLVGSFSVALAILSIQHKGDPFIGPLVKETGTEKQFDLDMIYAFIGHAPAALSSYIDNKSNAYMHLVSEYPSTIRFNVTRLPGNQISSCDAVVEVYGVIISTDKGPKEYHAYFIGTNYNATFSQIDKSKLLSVNYIVDHNLYSEITGGFVLNWADDTSVISNTVGSVGAYTNAPSNWTGLWCAGKPNTLC